MKKKLRKRTKLNIALCAIGKNENLYIREWVEWYKNIGISKIFLYDNNEKEGERFEDVINDYIQIGFVEIIDVRGVEKGCVYDNDGINLQPKCYIDCYENRVNDFDWVCFFDIDEFLTFKDNNNLFSFLKQKSFIDEDVILVSWQHYDDNNLVYYDNRPVMERFTHESKFHRHGVKSIVRTHKKILDKHQNNLIHIFRLEGNNTVYANGTKINDKKTWYVVSHKNHCAAPCQLNHYKTKTTDEYIKRHFGRHWGTRKLFTSHKKSLSDCMIDFFNYNEITDEKLKLFEQYRKLSRTTDVLLCAIVKNENYYLEEWVKHYQVLGVNKIVIYDNNDDKKEYIENIPYIKQLIDAKYIDVYHIPDKIAWQKEAYTECYQKYNKFYNWLMFFDIDEYLMLENSVSINEELAKQQFAKYDMIHVNWKIYDDNNLIKCENNYSVVNRFTHPMSKNPRANREIKSIIRGNLEKIEFTLNPHTVTNKILSCCDPLGNKVLSVNKYNNNICHKEMWLNHYICKTAEEFISIKLKRLGGSTKHEIGLRYNLEFFFLYNEKTPEKLKYFKDEIAKNFNETDSKKILKYNIHKPENLSKKPQTDDSITIKIINKPTVIKTLEPYKLPVKSITRKY